jgi:hypothetical protein
MDPKRTAHKVFNFKPYGSRKIGRPKLRWAVGVLWTSETGGIWL